MAALATLSILSIMSGIAAIAARSALPRRRAAFYVFKPLTTVLILTMVLAGGQQPWTEYRGTIAVGLLFCLAGDIWLMLPSDRFVTGLLSFLLGLLVYSYAFARGAPTVGSPWVALVFVVIGAGALRYLWAALTARIRVPVIAYVAVMVAMASLAAYRATAIPSIATIAAAIGASLFLASDTLLAIDRFRHPLRGSSTLILGSYYLGQLLIALSTVLPASAT